MLTKRGSTQAWGHTHTHTVHTVDRAGQSREEKKREENRADRNRTGQKTAQQNGSEKQSRNGNNRTGNNSPLRSQVAEFKFIPRADTEEYKLFPLNALRFECNRQTFPGRSGYLVNVSWERWV